MLPVSAPRPRSTRTATSGPDRSTSRAPSTPVPLTQTALPLNDTVIRSGSMVTGAIPVAASTRPQFGSDPKSAVLTRLSRAMVRATAMASSSVAAPVTVMTMRLVTPSASAISCAARSSHTDSTAASSSVCSTGIWLAPELSNSTVSLVDVEPSMSSLSNVFDVARRSARSSCSALARASVVSTHSIVASEGAIMPAPLAMPPMFHPCGWCSATCFGTVSVVMIA
ncbi:Uncharacterised protein [Mycobacteroides abscessus subsp. abscessus]|nr:Uncharacterised protein [Mycobacteroides abscessus subsp. abscessus]